MQLILNFAFALSVIATATAELEFRPHEGDNARRALFRGNDLRGCWGNFHQDGFCVEKIVDPDDTGSDKVKMTPCDGTNPRLPPLCSDHSIGTVLEDLWIQLDDIIPSARGVCAARS